MRGTRPLTDAEKEALSKVLPTPRDQLLFLMGITSGLRIQELLSINVSDIIQHGKIVDRVYVQKRHFKGKTYGRSVLVNPKLHTLIMDVAGKKPSHSPLFEGYMGQSLARQSAWRIIKTAANILQLQGKVATHSMRKTFAHKVYAATDKDIVKTAHALGHSDVNNTMHYLSFLTEELDKVILEM